jgi:hypothetical protein
MQMALPQSLFLNAFPLHCSGSHRFTRIPRARTRAERDALERQLGLRFWGTGDHLYATGEVDLPSGEVVDVACDDDRGLHLRGLKDALRDHATSRAEDAWFGFGGVLHVAGLLPPTRHGRALSEVELSMRVSDEGLTEPQTVLVARTRHRWSFTETLADVALQRVAIGGRALRISGSGPAQGEIVRFAGETIVLRRGDAEEQALAGDYRLRAGSALVRQVLGGDALFALQVASGALAAGHRRNQAAIKDRFLTLERALDALGDAFALPGGGDAQIERDPVAVRLQQGM